MPSTASNSFEHFSVGATLLKNLMRLLVSCSAKSSVFKSCCDSLAFACLFLDFDSAIIHSRNESGSCFRLFLKLASFKTSLTAVHSVLSIIFKSHRLLGVSRCVFEIRPQVFDLNTIEKHCAIPSFHRRYRQPIRFSKMFTYCF